MNKFFLAFVLLSNFCYSQEWETPLQGYEEAEKSKPTHTFTANVAIVSDYRFMGLSQTMRMPAIQGGFDYSHENGLYLGTWGSNVDGTTHYYDNTSMEWDFYGSFKGKLFPCALPDFGYNLGLIYYYYPGGKALNPHNTRWDSAEFYVELSYKYFSVRYWQMITNYFGFESNNTPFNWKKMFQCLPMEAREVLHTLKLILTAI